MDDKIKKVTDIQKPKKFSFSYKFIVFIMILAFTFQSLPSVNGHTYSPKGVSIHKHDCLTPVHLSYFCQE